MIMILVAHISIALASVAWSFYTYLLPSRTKLRLSSFLITATLVSGTALVLTADAPLVKSCLMGLGFMGLSLTGVLTARHKLIKVMQYTD